MNDDQFRQLLDDLGFSWQGYRKVRKGVMKRLVRHMRLLHISDAGDYLKRIRAVPEMRREAERLMTVPISRFFRDRPLWSAIKEKLLPDILSTDPACVRVWSAGCALGQEVYSFKMIWLLWEDGSGPLPPLILTATDMNQEYLDMAASGVYGSHISKDIPEACLKRFFRYDGQHYFVADTLKRDISWQRHDLAGSIPMAGPFHLIFLRNNLLTYYKEGLREGPLGRIAETLTAGGYLIIGAREVMPLAGQKLKRFEDYPGIFREN
jgi:chemotaxis methyl-accepting protein methylase